MDRLLRDCVSCSMTCHSVIPIRCSQYCVSWNCKAVSGQFYDTLLKKCLQCSELCGSHPEVCADACRSSGAVFLTQRPDVGGSAVQLVPGRGRALSGSALYSEALLYSLLGLCIIVLMFTLTAAVLLLLQRAKQQQHLDTTKQQLNKDGQSSKDSLIARMDEVAPERPRATETCVYCFSEHTDSDRSRALRIICSPTQTSM